MFTLLYILSCTYHYAWNVHKYMEKAPVRAASLPENQLFKLKFLLEIDIFLNFSGNFTIPPYFPPEIFFVAA